MPASRIHHEKRVLQLIAQGSEYAFTQLFDHYRNGIFGIALKFLKSPLLAEEVVQDVFLKIWLKRQDLNHVQNIEAYIITMARNLILDRLKKLAYEVAAKEELARQPAHINDTDHRLRQQQYEQLLRQAVNLLPPQQKQVYQLAKQEQMSYQDIADKMQLSRLTVKTHMAKALQFIRHYLHGHFFL